MSAVMKIAPDADDLYAELEALPENTLEAFALREGRWTVIGQLQEREIVSVEPFQEIALELGALWMETAED